MKSKNTSQQRYNRGQERGEAQDIRPLTSLTSPTSRHHPDPNAPTSPLSWYAGVSSMTLNSPTNLLIQSSPSSSRSASVSSTSTSRLSHATHASSTSSPSTQATSENSGLRRIPISFLINPTSHSPRLSALSVISSPPWENNPSPLSTTSHERHSQTVWNTPFEGPDRLQSNCSPHQTQRPSRFRSSSVQDLHSHSSLASSIPNPPMTRDYEYGFDRRSVPVSDRRYSATTPGFSWASGHLGPSSNSTPLFAPPPYWPTALEHHPDHTSSSHTEYPSPSSYPLYSPEACSMSTESDEPEDGMLTNVSSPLPMEQTDGVSPKEESPAPSSSTAKHQALLRSVRRTTNPDLKTTKTGKIQHKSRKAGVNRRSTAYNRFLQQQSKYLAKEYPHLTPQQRMKRIAEEWAFSDKNPHKTRRKSRFLNPDGTSVAGAGQVSATGTTAPGGSFSSATSVQPQDQVPILNACSTFSSSSVCTLYKVKTENDSRVEEL